MDGAGRRVPLVGGARGSGTASEQMEPGEFAVHFSTFAPGEVPFCVVLGGLEAAVRHAEATVAVRPALQCTIYDHDGLGKPPLRVVRGSAFKTGELSPGFRLWGGVGFLVVGGVLIAYDAGHQFDLGWPATIGVRLLIPGVVLLLTELALRVHARLQRRRERSS